MDYKDLNAKTADHGYQLPLVEDQLNRLVGSKFFKALDPFRVSPAEAGAGSLRANGIQ